MFWHGLLMQQNFKNFVLPWFVRNNRCINIGIYGIRLNFKINVPSI